MTGVQADFDAIERALRLVRQHVPATPLVHSPLLSERLSCDLWIKNETASPIASFKWRGALNAIVAKGSPQTVVTASTGNHGQGVAWAASRLGISSHVFAPSALPSVKRRKIEHFGASIHSVDGGLDQARLSAIAFAADRNIPMIDDGEDLAVIEGAATVGSEIADQLPDIDRVFVPMGSGSLASGIAMVMKERQPDARIIAVQSSGSPSMVDSFHARHAIVRPVNTIAEGLQCGTPAALALETLLAYVDDAVLVSDQDALEAMRLLMLEAQLLSEPSGAAGLAAAIVQKKAMSGKRVVVVATGANVVLDVLRMALA